MLLKTRNDGKGSLPIKYIYIMLATIIIPIFILNIASPPLVGCGQSRDEVHRSNARGIAGVISGTIARKHEEYLYQGIPYNVSAIIAETKFASGVVAPTVDGNTITWVLEPDTFTWTYTAYNGDTSAYLTEDSSSAFGISESTPWYEIAMGCISRMYVSLFLIVVVYQCGIIIYTPIFFIHRWM